MIFTQDGSRGQSNGSGAASRLTSTTTAEIFNRYARQVYSGRSPLYERLSLRIAEDPELLALAANARKNTALPNLFFGAVHLLLLKGDRHPLSAFYPSLSGSAKPDYSYPYFRSFILEHREEIREIITTHLVQTNEVGRCACLVPAFEIVARQAKRRPLALVEIGASAGLTLLWDRYGYNYGDGLQCGDPNSPVQIECSLRGENRPPIPKKFPTIASRVGVDLNPIDLDDPESVLWLRALIWPEHHNRVKQLQAAIQLARRYPPKVIPGDALELLPSILTSIPEDQVLCVYHSFVTSFLSHEAREKLRSLIAQHAEKRPLFLVSLEWYGKMEHPQLELVSYQQDVETGRILARCNSHGEWLEWLEWTD